MGRQEIPIDDTAGPAQEFAAALRREKAGNGGMTYRELSRRTGYSHVHLVRAAGGQHFPSWRVTQAFLRGCGVADQGQLALWSQYWVATRKRVRGARAATETAVDNTRGSDIYPAGNGRGRVTRPTRSALLIQTQNEFGALLRTLAMSMLDRQRMHLAEPPAPGHAQHRGISAQKQRKNDQQLQKRPETRSSLRQLAAATGISRSTLSNWFTGSRLPGPYALRDFAIIVGATETETAELLQVRDQLDRARGGAATQGPLFQTARAIAESADTREMEALRTYTGSLLETTQKRQQQRHDEQSSYAALRSSNNDAASLDDLVREKLVLWAAATTPLVGGPKHRRAIPIDELVDREQFDAARLAELLEDRDSATDRTINTVKARAEIDEHSTLSLRELFDGTPSEQTSVRRDDSRGRTTSELHHHSSSDELDNNIEQRPTSATEREGLD